jgi:hypothetical protein
MIGRYGIVSSLLAYTGFASLSALFPCLSHYAAALLRLAHI